MFKLLTLSCLLAATAYSKSFPSPAVPYYPQPYQQAYYPQAYPQVYPGQLKYNVQPAFAPSLSYIAPGYRQVLVPANPASNPYYYGYAPYPAYPQPYPYPYAPANDGAQAPAAAAQPGWGEYFSNFWNYVPNFPTSFGGASEQESENSASAASETPSSASPGKGDKPTEGQNVEQKPTSDGSQLKQFLPAYQLPYLGQPQFYGQLPYPSAVYDSSKSNAAQNGAVFNNLLRNQPYQHPVFHRPQPNQGSALAYQQYLQYQKQTQQNQHEEPSVVVDSNASGVQANDEGQQQAQSKLATGPTVAVAQPQGVAFAGIGGRAGAGPAGTAIVGNNSTAIAGPRATAVSLDLEPTINLTPVHKLTAVYVAKYSPELGVYRVAEIKPS